MSGDDATAAFGLTDGQVPWLPMKNHRERMPRFPRAVDNARDLPALRGGLLAMAAHDGAWEASEVQRHMVELVGQSPINKATQLPGTSILDGNLMIQGPRGFDKEQLPGLITTAQARGRNMVAWYREHLPATQLIYVTEPLTDVVVSAADSVPEDTMLTPGALPAASGLAVFARPWQGIDAGNPGHTLRVDAVLWGLSVLPPGDTDWSLTREDEFVVPSVSMASFRLIEPGQQDWIATQFCNDPERPLDRPIWLPLGRTDWPFGTRIDDPYREGLTDTAWASMYEDRRFAASLWAVLQQHRLTERVTVLPDRARRRQNERAGYVNDPVQVIHLRRPEYRPVETEGTPGRHVSVRFPVRPHWRNQACGPGRLDRRLILVPPHLRGPEDAPMVHTERIWKLDQ